MKRLLLLAALLAVAAGPPPDVVDASTLDRKITCGYQGWFRCPGDAADSGWVHWSRDGKRLTKDTLSVEMWPDTAEYADAELYAVPGFTLPGGKPARLFSSDDAATVLRHFRWMKGYGIDGAWLQHFVVELPGAPGEKRHPSRLRVLNHVRAAAKETGRAWALTYDMTGMPADRLVDVLTADWKRQVDGGATADGRYLHHAGKPAVMLFGFYRDKLTPEQANKLVDFFKAGGPYAAHVVGGGEWFWRRGADPAWRAVWGRFDTVLPWNVGNLAGGPGGVKAAATAPWADDLAECERLGVRWLPVVYPGFSWDNLKRKPAGTTTVPRRKGAFLWEQFHGLAKLKVDTAYVAMFDEVDEATAIFKVTDGPPVEGHFVGTEGMPGDWYLRLTGEGGRMLRGERPIVPGVPLVP